MSYKILGNYIKKLKFNIPDPETFFLLSKDISNYKINIDIKSSQVKQNIIEVLITLSLNPIKKDFRNEKMFILFILQFLFFRSEKDLENISFM